LFAGSGVGKSVLLGMMSRFTEADVVIVALVGERGKEVREFVESNLSGASLAKAVIVAAPADETPVMRLRSGMYATRLAEYFRDQGKRTLLLFDSLTRYAQAQREIALATGEPPATKGYPPSVFARLPQLVERAGNGSGNGGSVTAIYTVLVEGDDLNDPIADSARAILDGHIILSREIAEQAIYPAVDIQASVSRAMAAVVDQSHLRTALKVKQLYARYQQSKDLINVGAYVAGADDITDLAVSCQPAIEAFLTQSHVDRVSFDDSVSALTAILPDTSDSHAENNPQTDTSFVSEMSSSPIDPVVSNNV
jgi:flagellum-specific ATP synthase